MKRCTYNCDNGLCHNHKMGKEYCRVDYDEMPKCLGYAEDLPKFIPSLDETDKLKEVIIEQLYQLESNILANVCSVARLLKLFGKEPYSIDGMKHLEGLHD